MEYKLELFDKDNNSWYVIKSGKKLEYLLYYLELHKKQFPEDHFRVISLIKML